MNCKSKNNYFPLQVTVFFLNLLSKFLLAECGVDISDQEQVIADFFRIEIADIYIKCKQDVLGYSGSGIDCPFSGETPSCRGYETDTLGIRCYDDDDCAGIGKKYYGYTAECDRTEKICKVISHSLFAHTNTTLV